VSVDDREEGNLGRETGADAEEQRESARNGNAEEARSPSGAAADEPANDPPALEDLVLLLRDQLTELRSRIEALPTRDALGEAKLQPAAVTQDLATHAETLARLSAELDEQRDQLRDYEKSLVERIADVDDDRRTTASMLQRAWQGHREQVDYRLRRTSRNTSVALVLLAISVFATLFVVYRQAATDRATLSHDISDVNIELQRRSQAGTLDNLVQSKLTQLSAALGEVSGSLNARNAQQEQDIRAALEQERTARSDSDGRLVRALERLEAQQRALAERIERARKVTIGAAVEAGAGEHAQETDEAKAAKVGSEGGTSAVQTPAVATLAAGGSGAVAGAPAAESATGAPVSEEQQKGGSDQPAVSAPLVLTNPKYAIQLIGFHGFHDLERFAARPELSQPVYYLEETSKGRPLYLVMHGLHNDRAGAQAALSSLPPALARLDPLVRSLPAGTELWPCHSGKCEGAER
jgi:DamX protein